MKHRFEPAPGKIIIKPNTKRSAYLTASGLITIEHGASVNLGEIHASYEPFIDPIDGVETEPFYKKGDMVLYGQHSGVRVTIGRESYIAMMEREIITKVHFEAEEGDPVEVTDQIILPPDFAEVSRKTQAIRNVEDQI